MEDRDAAALGAAGRPQLALYRDALALGLAAAVFGVSFGALAVSARLTLIEVMALSAFCFTGASQFAFAAVVAGGGPPLAGVASALLLGARNGLYALRLRELLPRRLRLLQAQFVIDETTGMTLAQDNPSRRLRAFTVTAASVFVLWNAGTLTGVLLGMHFGDPHRLGIDAAGPAVFLALLVPLVRGRPELLAAALAALVTLLTAAWLPPGLPLLAAAAVSLAAVAISDR